MISIDQNKNGITASIIADSLQEHGQRLTTFVLVFPRIVLAEFNTHRTISRNSASSRAIPFEKMLKMVKENPFIPIKWIKDHTGMQGNEYFPKEWNNDLTSRWLIARDYAVQQASLLSNVGVTKQFCNRLLEPFMYHKVIATASDWGNFFALRAHEAAEIHIQELAYKMLEAYNESRPKLLKPGEWHIPFGDKFDEDRIKRVFKAGEGPKNIQEAKIQISTARCARISYNNFDGKDDYEADIKLHDRLLASGHMSPFEHCARATDDERHYGNFTGFLQYRKLMPNENKTDDRIKK